MKQCKMKKQGKCYDFFYKDFQIWKMSYLPDWWILLSGLVLTEENNTNGCLSSSMSRSLAMGHMKSVFSSSHV